MILEKNNLQTVQELNKPYIELLNSLTCTPKKIAIIKQNNPVAYLHHLYSTRLIGQLRNIILRYKAGYKTR